MSPTAPTCVAGSYAGLPGPIPITVCANTQPVFPIVAAVFIAGYIGLCLAFSFFTRKISNVFSERELMAACLSMAVVGGVCAVIYFFTESSSQIKVSLAAFGLSWGSTFTVMLLVGPKLWLIAYHNDETVRQMAFETPPSRSGSGGARASVHRGPVNGAGSAQGVASGNPPAVASGGAGVNGIGGGGGNSGANVSESGGAVATAQSAPARPTARPSGAISRQTSQNNDATAARLRQLEDENAALRRALSEAKALEMARI